MQQILHGDVWASLSEIIDNSVDCAITSPPYYDQRDYEFEGQIGNEETFERYIAKLVTIFRKLRSKLHPKGVFYLNIGDKYISKYGNAPLGMIPFQVAYYLVEDGWVLNDIIIWHKPNHMPSGVKNRFTNTYEPIFVLSKNKSNYYESYKRRNNISNILRIPIQQTKFKHMATYPEKLIEEILSYGLPKSATILDPFAGSGTTAKAAQNLNRKADQPNPVKYSTIMIEAFDSYIEIMKNRCIFDDIQKISYEDCIISPIINNANEIIESHKIRSPEPYLIKPGSVIVKIFEKRDEFHDFISLIKEFESSLSDDGILFIGLPNQNIKDLYLMANFKKIGWIVRNLIVVPKNNDWIPVFMLVKDIKSVRYRFNLDKIRVNHKSSNGNNHQNVEFIGYRVIQPSSLYKTPREGLIVRVIEKYPDGLPHRVIVKWDNKITSEEVINGGSVSEIKFRCSNCDSILKNYYHYLKAITCPKCNVKLWDIADDQIVVPNLINLIPMKSPSYESTEEMTKIEVRNDFTHQYNGKFKGVNRKNMGQSPGARSSVQEAFFTVKRYHEIKQPMISDYFNLHRKKMGLSKKALTEIFPPEYKHTVGHWIRKDMGGSLPKIEDLEILSEKLELDENYVKYIMRMGLKLQAVVTDVKGKNPGDFLDKPLKYVVEMLNKLGNP